MMIKISLRTCNVQIEEVMAYAGAINKLPPLDLPSQNPLDVAVTRGRESHNLLVYLGNKHRHEQRGCITRYVRMPASFGFS